MPSGGSKLTVAEWPEPAGAAPTRYADSPDGTRIAYDVSGRGPFVLLLHGGGQTRRVWHELGYVERLRDRVTVVAIDLRGSGESDKPTTSDAYRIDRVCEDITAVADAVGARRFALWGFSYGANIGRYLAAGSDRVETFAMIGVPFGPGASGSFRQMIIDLRSKWQPVIDAARAGVVDPSTLAETDRAVWQRGSVPQTVAWLAAMLDWPSVEPDDLRCRTLWLVGSANQPAMDSAREYETGLAGSAVTLLVVPGLTHEQELVRIDDVLPHLLRFTIDN